MRCQLERFCIPSVFRKELKVSSWCTGQLQTSTGKFNLHGTNLHVYQLCVWGDLFLHSYFKGIFARVKFTGSILGKSQIFLYLFCFRQEKDIEISYINITSLYFHLMQRGEAQLSSLCRILHFHWNHIAFSIKCSQKKNLQIWVEICLELDLNLNFEVLLHV